MTVAVDQAGQQEVLLAIQYRAAIAWRLDITLGRDLAEAAILYGDGIKTIPPLPCAGQETNVGNAKIRSHNKGEEKMLGHQVKAQMFVSRLVKLHADVTAVHHAHDTGFLYPGFRRVIQVEA